MARLLLATAVVLAFALGLAGDAAAGCLPASFGTQPTNVDPLGIASANFLGCFTDLSGRSPLRVFLGNEARLIMNFDTPFTTGPGDDFAILTGSPMAAPAGALLEFFLAGQLQASFEGSLAPNEVFQFDLPNGLVANRVVVTNIGQGVITLDDARAVHITPERVVTIDVKPGNFENVVNPTSNGVTRVAILSTATFDATTIDPASIAFLPNGATLGPRRDRIKDINGDGLPDVVFHFGTDEMGISCGDRSVFLTGRTFDGETFGGSDFIRTVGCDRKSQ